MVVSLINFKKCPIQQQTAYFVVLFIRSETDKQTFEDVLISRRRPQRNVQAESNCVRSELKHCNPIYSMIQALELLPDSSHDATRLSHKRPIVVKQSNLVC